LPGSGHERWYCTKAAALECVATMAP
jgi:hypothetical protein